MVDAERAVGGGAGGVAPGAWEQASHLLIVQDAAVAVVGHAYFVRLLHVRGARVVAADPGGQATPRVGPDGEHRPVEGLQGFVDPVQVLSTVSGEEGVRHPELEDAKLGACLQMKGLPDVKFEAGVVPCSALPAIDIDRCRHPFLTSPEAPRRRGVGLVADLPCPLRVGQPPRVIHVAAAAAPDVVALALADRAAAQQLPHHLAEDRPHFRSQSVLPSACRTFRRGASGSG